MAGRRKRRKKQNKWLCMLALLILAETLAFQDPEEPSRATVHDLQMEELSEDSSLRVHFLDVGQGDATLITCDGQNMLIDAGNNDKGTQIQLYLEKLGIERLDYVIGTHPDADHIGGLDVILYKFDCGTIFMPDLEKDTRTYEDVVQTLKYKNYKSSQPEVGDSYVLGSAVFTIVAPGLDYGEDANNASIGILLQHGENHFLFTGDAEEESEQAMLESGIDLSADVFKAAHHGSSTANTEEFLEAVSPTYAVISCGEDNSYGHPHREVMEEFSQMGIEVWRTDEDGTIVAASDGKEIQIYGTD